MQGNKAFTALVAAGVGGVVSRGDCLQRAVRDVRSWAMVLWVSRNRAHYRVNKHIDGNQCSP